MTDVIVVGEGRTEEAFVRSILAPEVGSKGIFLYSRSIPTSKSARGGALTWNRVRKYLRDTIVERDDVYVTTFFDLYGLKSDFPGFAQAQRLGDPRDRAVAIEKEIHAAVVKEAGCRADRFVPYIQPYEFESLLFSDVDALPMVRMEWQVYVEKLRQARQQAISPEHINDGDESHPSARLTALLKPRYEKVIHGAALAGRIGTVRIRQECAHFGAWLAHIEALPAARGDP